MLVNTTKSHKSLVAPLGFTKATTVVGIHTKDIESTTHHQQSSKEHAEADGQPPLEQEVSQPVC